MIKHRQLFIILLSLTLFMANCQAANEADQAQHQPAPPLTNSVEPSKTPEALIASVAPIGSAIKWHSYEDGMKLGKDQKKKIFINFYADWCQYCKLMDKNTFTDGRVISYLNEKFIAIKVDSDKNLAIAQKYSVSGLPVFWILNEEGVAIGQQPGYMEPEKIMPLLQFVGSDSYKSMKYKDFLNKL